MRGVTVNSLFRKREECTIKCLTVNHRKTAHANRNSEQGAIEPHGLPLLNTLLQNLISNYSPYIQPHSVHIQTDMNGAG